MNTKRCSKCGLYKPLDAFNRAARNLDGRRNQCRDCDKKYQEEYNRRKPPVPRRRRRRVSPVAVGDGCVCCGTPAAYAPKYMARLCLSHLKEYARS